MSSGLVEQMNNALLELAAIRARERGEISRRAREAGYAPYFIHNALKLARDNPDHPFTIKTYAKLMEVLGFKMTVSFLQKS